MKNPITRRLQLLWLIPGHILITFGCIFYITIEGIVKETKILCEYVRDVWVGE